MGLVPSLGTSEGLASLSRSCPSPETRRQCEGLRTPFPRSLQYNPAPDHHLPGPVVQGEGSRPRGAAGSTRLRQGAELWSTWPHSLGDPAAAVPPPALLLTNETGPRPPRSADLTSGPAPAGLQRLALQLSAAAWSWRRRRWAR